jgi:hypothetical protein
MNYHWKMGSKMVNKHIKSGKTSGFMNPIFFHFMGGVLKWDYPQIIQLLDWDFP